MSWIFLYIHITLIYIIAVGLDVTDTLCISYCSVNSVMPIFGFLYLYRTFLFLLCYEDFV